MSYYVIYVCCPRSVCKARPFKFGSKKGEAVSALFSTQLSPLQVQQTNPILDLLLDQLDHV